MQKCLQEMKDHTSERSLTADKKKKGRHFYYANFCQKGSFYFLRAFVHQKSNDIDMFGLIMFLHETPIDFNTTNTAV